MKSKKSEAESCSGSDSSSNGCGCFFVFSVLFFIAGILTLKYYIGFFLLVIAVSLFIISIVVSNINDDEKTEKIECIESTISLKQSTKIMPNPDPRITFDSVRDVSTMPQIEFSGISKKTPFSKVFPLVVIDVETTGVGQCADKIIEVSALKFENGFALKEYFSTLINPKRSIKAKATAVNHITDDMVADAPLFSQIKPQLQSFVAGCNIAGYNLRFVLEFLYHGGLDFDESVKYYNVCDLVQKRISEEKIEDYKLTTVCEFYNISIQNAHRSLYDSIATAEVFKRIYQSK